MRALASIATGRRSKWLVVVAESEVAYVITISDGRLVREQPFRSHTEALEAAGLSQ